MKNNILRTLAMGFASIALALVGLGAFGVLPVSATNIHGLARRAVP